MACENSGKEAINGAFRSIANRCFFTKSPVRQVGNLIVTALELHQSSKQSLDGFSTDGQENGYMHIGHCLASRRIIKNLARAMHRHLSTHKTWT